MALARLIPIGSEQAIPPGEIESEVAVGLPRQNGVMHPVHVRCHQHPSQHPVQRPGKAHVAVVEHGRAVQHHFEYHHRHCRSAQHRDCGQLDPHGQHNLEGVKTHSGGHIEIQIGVVHPVHPPQQRHGMEHHVLKVDDQVQRRQRERHRYRERNGVRVQQPPAALLRKEGHPHRQKRKTPAQDEAVDHHHPQVAAPAQGAGLRQGAPWRGKFPSSDQNEHSEEKPQPDLDLMEENKIAHFHPS